MAQVLFMFKHKIKHVKDVSSVNQSLCVTSVPNVPLAALPPPVGGQLLKFWQRWAALGSSLRVVSIQKEG